MADKFWVAEENKAVVEGVIGTDAIEYFTWLDSNNILSEFEAQEKDLQLRDRLSKIIQGSDWKYIIYWQVSTSKSGKSALVWGDGHCKEPNASHSMDDFRYKPEISAEGNKRKLALEKIYGYFGGRKDRNIVASKLDSVSQVEMFYLTSIYFVFPFDRPSTPSLAFNTSRTIWASDIDSCLEHYESRAFLANSAGFKTVAFIPLKSGVVEIGSRKSLLEDRRLIHMVKTRLESCSVQYKVLPKIFRQDVNHEYSRSGPVSINFSQNAEDDMISHSDSYELQTFGNRVYESYTGYKIDDVELNMSMISTFEHAGDDYYIQSEDQNHKRRGKNSTRGGADALHHVIAERHRRERLKQRFYALRSIVPNISKMDKTSLLGDAIAYITDLKKKIRVMEAEKEKLDNDKFSTYIADIDVQERHEDEDTIVKASFPLNVHPVSRVIQALKEHQVLPLESNVSVTDTGKVVHTFSIKSPSGGVDYLKEKLAATLLN